MASHVDDLDKLFYNEFHEMMNGLAMKHPKGNINDRHTDAYPVPDYLYPKNRPHIIESKEYVLHNIEEQYFDSLNNETGIEYKGALTQRQLDSKGGYAVDTEGNILLKEIQHPMDCLALYFDKPIGVPNKGYSPKEEGFMYVDKADNALNGKDLYLYLIPKKYCFEVHRTALIFSQKGVGDSGRRAYYAGKEVAMTNGTWLFMYVIPFDNYRTNYSVRVVATAEEPSTLIEMMGKIHKYWVEKGLAFNPIGCKTDYIKNGSENRKDMNRVNMAYRDLIPNIDTYSYAEGVAADKDTELESATSDVAFDDDFDISTDIDADTEW